MFGNRALLLVEEAIAPESRDAATLKEQLADAEQRFAESEPGSGKRARAGVEAWPLAASGAAAPEPQDHAQATHAPKITRELARIRWTEPADAVARLVRAMDPRPGAWSTVHGQEIKFFGPQPADPPPSDAVPGQVVATETALVIATGGGAVSHTPETVTALRDRGVELFAVTAPEEPRAHRDSLGTALLLQQQGGVETIVTMTTWDKTIMTLQADLLGAHVTAIDGRPTGEAEVCRAAKASGVEVRYMGAEIRSLEELFLELVERHAGGP